MWKKLMLLNVQSLLKEYLIRVVTTTAKHTEVCNRAAHDNFKTSDWSPGG